MNSLSGGQTSSYIAAHYPADFDVFALVTVEDSRLTPDDPRLVREVSDRIGREFIGTVEEPEILCTMLDLEQHIGRKIHWVAGPTFEQVIRDKGGYLPNIVTRFCTTELKLRPIFEFWQREIGEPVEMRIGFRVGEEKRAERMIERTNDDGLVSLKHVVGKMKGGRNKWGETAYQRPAFPLLRDGIRADHIRAYWNAQNVRFANRNNCVGCFHRNPMLLRKMADVQPGAFNWFVEMEANNAGQWQKELTYSRIQRHRLQAELSFDDFADCDSGHCGL